MNKINKPDAVDSTLANLRSGDRTSKNYAVGVIDQLQQRITALEQQLKTAKQEAVRIFANQQADLIANIDGASTRDAAIHKGISVALLAQSQCYIRMLDEEYANNLEGK